MTNAGSLGLVGLGLLAACSHSRQTVPEARAQSSGPTPAEVVSALPASSLSPQVTTLRSRLITPSPTAATVSGPTPLVRGETAVDWWFAFKFNAATYSGCSAAKVCPFGGTPQRYKSGEGEKFAVATRHNQRLTLDTRCIGESLDDPVGATFSQVYAGSFFYVIWNDQFYDAPKIHDCKSYCAAPWGHSKGLVAWGPEGDGFVMQVTTPSWPASGSKDYPRDPTDGNTLGCVHDDNVLVSQHFFALKLSHADLLELLRAMVNASVATDRGNRQIVHSGGPKDVMAMVGALGKPSNGRLPTNELLSTGVRLISKPSALQVPPWQMVSAVLGGTSLRVATWWQPGAASNPIPSTTRTTPIDCWDDRLGAPGAIEIATTGTWEGKPIGLLGGVGTAFNHAKLGVAVDASNLVVLGDMNQQGALSGNCSVSQNGRGGLFFVLDDAEFHRELAALLRGDSAKVHDAYHPGTAHRAAPRCCKQCKTSKPCGDTCIALTAACAKPQGCACKGE